MTSSIGKRIITIPIFPNVSRSKDNRTVKFGQLMKYNVRNIFLEKLHTTWAGESSLDLFRKKLKLSISLDQQTEILCSFFLLEVQVEGYQNILQLSC